MKAQPYLSKTEGTVVCVSEEELRQLDPEVQGSPGAAVEGMLRVRRCVGAVWLPAFLWVATPHYGVQVNQLVLDCLVQCLAVKPWDQAWKGHILAEHVAEVFRDLGVSTRVSPVRATSEHTLQGPRGEGLLLGDHPLGDQPTGDCGLTSEDLTAEWGAMAAVCQLRGGRFRQPSRCRHQLTLSPHATGGRRWS
ncbi:Hypothetical predicted protein [Mytilus galloprovincialis]|uniref:Uncharacterized protein n=1 Tax=Mytilus galloprovincialis TaxID=29158 RepID=A0A8B6BLA9_MYTGA|nr:Hypothetical predicted protein [Mytilus galloprovincialis]